jgi:protein gp37
MSEFSKIEWTERTWNTLSDCTMHSLGCQNCYAERHTRRLQKNPNIPKYRADFDTVVCHQETLEEPLRWRKPSVLFVNSTSDLFHAEVPFEFIDDVFDVMRRADQHVYQVLTKRAERMAEYAQAREWPDHVWAGVTVEYRLYADRIESLKKVPAAVRFLSIEPMLGPMPGMDLEGIHWVIVGGESGPGARPMEKEWVIDVRDQCVAADVPFFFKQWGGVNKKKRGRKLHGRNWDVMPVTVSKDVAA